MLRIDNRAEMVRMPWSFMGMFKGRHAIQLSKTRVSSVRWKREAAEALLVAQQNEPVMIGPDGRRTLWMFHDRFWWDDEGSGATTSGLWCLLENGARSRRFKARIA